MNASITNLASQYHYGQEVTWSVPIPGLSISVDMSAIVTKINSYYVELLPWGDNRLLFAVATPAASNLAPFTIDVNTLRPTGRTIAPEITARLLTEAAMAPVA